jgi:hypothetical protein
MLFYKIRNSRNIIYGNQGLKLRTAWNYGPHHLMRPQYCGCGWQRNRIRPQLQCELKSHTMPQWNHNATVFWPQRNRIWPQRSPFNISFRKAEIKTRESQRNFRKQMKKVLFRDILLLKITFQRNSLYLYFVKMKIVWIWLRGVYFSKRIGSKIGI